MCSPSTIVCMDRLVLRHSFSLYIVLYMYKTKTKDTEVCSKLFLWDAVQAIMYILSDG